MYKAATAIEDRLSYNEPPDWFFSVRHPLGQVLMEAGRFEEAEKVYQDDLKEWKENGWALKGLSIALQKQGKTAEAAATEARFKAAWKWSQLQLNGSVL